MRRTGRGKKLDGSHGHRGGKIVFRVRWGRIDEERERLERGIMITKVAGHVVRREDRRIVAGFMEEDAREDR